MARHVLRVIREPGMRRINCLSCGSCCQYITAPLPGPSAPSYASDLMWMLYHAPEKGNGFALATDTRDGSWFFYFPHPCRFFNPEDNKCRIYNRKELVAHEYDARECEVNFIPNPHQEGAIIQFETAEELLRYIRQHHSKVFNRMRRYVPEDMWRAALAEGPAGITTYGKRPKRCASRA